MRKNETKSHYACSSGVSSCGDDVSIRKSDDLYENTFYSAFCLISELLLFEKEVGEKSGTSFRVNTFLVIFMTKHAELLMIDLSVDESAFG